VIDLDGALPEWRSLAYQFGMLRQTTLAAFLALVTAVPALAQVPSTLPANTVLGRLGVIAGKPQAIPFDTLFSAANVQPVTANLTALLALGSTGFPTRTGTNTWAQRSVVGTANEITVTNGNGVSGNPTISLPAAITLTGKTATGGTFTGAALNGTLGATTPSTIAATAVSANGTISSTNALGANTRGVLSLVNPIQGTVGSIFGSVGANTIAQIDLLSDGSATSGALDFYTYNATVAGVRMHIDKAGNVGIGTVTPAATLDVSGSAKVSGGLTTTGTIKFVSPLTP
jgi:hypothetical protein